MDPENNQTTPDTTNPSPQPPTPTPTAAGPQQTAAGLPPAAPPAPAKKSMPFGMLMVVAAVAVLIFAVASYFLLF